MFGYLEFHTKKQPTTALYTVSKHPEKVLVERDGEK